jgi:hypothetical protein
MAFPSPERCYASITNTAEGTSDYEGGIGAFLTEIDSHGNFSASCQLKDHKKNYSPF